MPASPRASDGRRLGVVPVPLMLISGTMPPFGAFSADDEETTAALIGKAPFWISAGLMSPRFSRRSTTASPVASAA